MNSLTLDPLPCAAFASGNRPNKLRSDGFVDETIVASVIARDIYERVYVGSENMALSSSEYDYAGWELPETSPCRDRKSFAAKVPAVEAHAAETHVIEVPESAFTRLPAPPFLNRPRKSSVTVSDQVQTADTSWWFFALCGVLTCGILTLIFLIISHRAQVGETATDHRSVPAGVEESMIHTPNPESESTPSGSH